MGVLKDHYKVLGIKRNANGDDIKKAYRNLAKQFHPDKNKAKDAEEKFKEIGAAYEILKDADKKRTYDNQLLGDEEKARMEKERKSNPPPPPPTYTFTTTNKSNDHTKASTSKPSEEFESKTKPTRFYDSDSDDDFYTAPTYSSTKEKSKKFSEKEKAGTKKKTGRVYHPTWTNDDSDMRAFFRAFSKANDNQFSFMFTTEGSAFGDFDEVFQSFFESSMGSMFDDPFFGLHTGRNTQPTNPGMTSARRSTSSTKTKNEPMGPGPSARRKSKAEKEMEDMWDWSKPVFKQKNTDDFMLHSDEETTRKHTMDLNNEQINGPSFEESLLPCGYCGRKFAILRLADHEAVCAKLSGKAAADTPLGRERLRKQEEFLRNLRDIKAKRNAESEQAAQHKTEGPDGAGNITCRWCGETMLRTLADKHMPMCFQRHQQGRRPFGSSAKAGFRPTAGRMPDGSSTAGTPGGKSFRFDSDSDNTDDEGIGTGGIFHKTQTAHDAPPTTPRRQPQASAKKPTGAAASSSSKFASTPSKPTQRSTKPNVSGVKGTSTFGTRPTTKAGAGS